MRALLLALASTLAFPAFGQDPKTPPALGNEAGFFKPAADPALTRIEPPRSPAPPPAEETADQIRAAEEARLDRAEREHRLAAEAAARTNPRPAITSPLDGTAPIASPIDGTAPIISPVTR